MPYKGKHLRDIGRIYSESVAQDIAKLREQLEEEEEKSQVRDYGNSSEESQEKDKLEDLLSRRKNLLQNFLVPNDSDSDSDSEDSDEESESESDDRVPINNGKIISDKKDIFKDYDGEPIQLNRNVKNASRKKNLVSINNIHLSDSDDDVYFNI